MDKGLLGLFRLLRSQRLLGLLRLGEEIFWGHHFFFFLLFSGRWLL